MANTYLIGGGGGACEILEALLAGQPDFRLAGLFDDDFRLKQNNLDLPYCGTNSEFLERTNAEDEYLLGFTDNTVREEFDQLYATAGRRAFTVVHPLACVSAAAQIGGGSYLAAFAFIGPQAILGRGAIVNVGASVGHHCEVQDYAQICPGARISASARIGRGAFIASNAVVAPGGIVGDYAKLAGCSLSPKNLPASVLALGVPAKPI